VMCAERGGKLHAMDERYCIDNGAMIGAHPSFPRWVGVGVPTLSRQKHQRTTNPNPNQSMTQ